MRFGLFGSAQAKRGGPSDDNGAGFREFVERQVEAEALGYHSTFLVEHHFTGFGQVSATLNLLTWIGARTTTLRLGTAVLVLPWHNPVLLAEQVATLDLLSGGRVGGGIGKGYRCNEFAGFRIPMQEFLMDKMSYIKQSHKKTTGGLGAIEQNQPGESFSLHRPQEPRSWRR